MYFIRRTAPRVNRSWFAPTAIGRYVKSTAAIRTFFVILPFFRSSCCSWVAEEQGLFVEFVGHFQQNRYGILFVYLRNTNIMNTNIIHRFKKKKAAYRWIWHCVCIRGYATQKSAQREKNNYLPMTETGSSIRFDDWSSDKFLTVFVLSLSGLRSAISVPLKIWICDILLQSEPFLRLHPRHPAVGCCYLQTVIDDLWSQRSFLLFLDLYVHLQDLRCLDV